MVCETDITITSYSHSTFHVMMGLFTYLKLSTNINPFSFRTLGQLQVTEFILHILFLI